MAGMGHGSYLLTAIRVFDDETAHSHMKGTRNRKRERNETEDGEKDSKKLREDETTEVDHNADETMAETITEGLDAEQVSKFVDATS